MQNSSGVGARSVVDVGTVIDETYIIEAMIGRGGMGAVYLASHKRLQGKKVAIKTLHAELGGQEILARFKREADIASQLDHPNIVKVENYNVLPDGTPYIVYEYLQGESLAARIAEVGALSIDFTFSVLRQIGSALGAAHRAGVVHRDLKPQNIFLSPSEVDGRATELAKVLDFGISKIIGGTQSVKTQEQTLLGTPQYMAPEQATGQHSTVDERTDIFALGAILYEMVSGRPAFSGVTIPEVVFKVVYEEPPPLSEVAPNVADVIAMVIKKAMAKAPSDRYATVAELVEAMTGSPLSLARKPRNTSAAPIGASTPSQNLKNSSGDAFAKTMGSGDHGASPVSVSAATLDSQSPAKKPIDADASTQMAQSIQHVVKVPPVRKGGLALVLAAVIVVLVGGIAIYFATRTNTAPDPKVVSVQPQPQPAVVVVDAAPVAVVQAEPIDAGVVKKPDAGVKAAVVKPKIEEEADVGGDESVRQELIKSEKLFNEQSYQQAMIYANHAKSLAGATPYQKGRGSMLHGMVMCAQNHDQGEANTDLRLIAAFPKMRERLIHACHDAGIELSR